MIALPSSGIFYENDLLVCEWVSETADTEIVIVENPVKGLLKAAPRDY